MKGHIKFVRNNEKGSDADIVYDVINKNEDILGDIAFDDEWKKWVFFADDSSYFDSSCLRKIVEFMEGLN